MFYTVFISASHTHIGWIRKEIFSRLQVKGHITRDSKKSTYQLRYAKKESLKILRKIYSTDNVLCLSRKHLKIKRAVSIIGQTL